MATRGGKRPNAGRKAGAITRKTREIANQLIQDGITPLEYMLSVLRDASTTPATRMDAAKAAAPYIHPRLAAVEHSGGLAVTHEQALAALNDDADGDDATPPAEG